MLYGRDAETIMLGVLMGSEKTAQKKKKEIGKKGVRLEWWWGLSHTSLGGENW